MKTISGTLAAYLAGPNGIKARTLFWMTVKDRGTGAPVTFGFWNGDDDATFTIAGVPRLYYGAGDLALPEPLTYQVGMSVNTYSLDLAPLSPDVQSALRTYDPRLAPVEIHRAFFNTSTDVLIEEPMRVFKGQVDEAPIGTPDVNGEATATIRMSSSAVFLTRRLTQTKSESMQRLRSDDRFFRWTDITGQVTVAWGVK
jgi:hypothetical protein